MTGMVHPDLEITFGFTGRRRRPISRPQPAMCTVGVRFADLQHPTPTNIAINAMAVAAVALDVHMRQLRVISTRDHRS